MQAWRSGSEWGVGGAGPIQMKMQPSPGQLLELRGVYINSSIEKVSTFFIGNFLGTKNFFLAAFYGIRSLKKI